MLYLWSFWIPHLVPQRSGKLIVPLSLARFLFLAQRHAMNAELSLLRNLKPLENGDGRCPPNKAFQRDKVAVSHLLQRAQKLCHNNFAPEQRRYVVRRPKRSGNVSN